MYYAHYGEGYQIDVWQAETGHNITPGWTKEAANAVEVSRSDFPWAPDGCLWLGNNGNDSVINVTQLHVVDIVTGKLVGFVHADTADLWRLMGLHSAFSVPCGISVSEASSHHSAAVSSRVLRSCKPQG